jgi:serine/threonine protein phosphatase PrpC
VYDGHGGDECAIMIEKLLHKTIIEDSLFTTDISNSIRNGFLSTDKQVLDVSSKDNWCSGSTVVVTAITNKTLYLGNVGDSEAVLAKRTSNGYEPILLSQKQKPSDNGERDRIKKAGGHVVFGRVMGTLAVSRAIGDRDFKVPFNRSEADFVSAEPYLHTIQLEDEHEFLIVACDGLWDKVSYKEAVDFIGVEREKGHSAKEASKNIVRHSYEKGSQDNITTIIIYLSKHPSMPYLLEKKEFNDSEEDEEVVVEVEEIEDEVDVYTFLQREAERKLASTTHGSPKAKKLFNLFKLPDKEAILEEHLCSLENTLLYNGTLIITQNYLCFHSNAFGRKTTRQLSINEIETIKKHKSLVIMNAITIETNTGKKFIFNWNQNRDARDKAFRRILELINGSNGITISSSTSGSTSQMNTGNKEAGLARSASQPVTHKDPKEPSKEPVTNKDPSKLDDPRNQRNGRQTFANGKPPVIPTTDPSLTNDSTSTTTTSSTPSENKSPASTPVVESPMTSTPVSDSLVASNEPTPSDSTPIVESKDIDCEVTVSVVKNEVAEKPTSNEPAQVVAEETEKSNNTPNDSSSTSEVAPTETQTKVETTEETKTSSPSKSSPIEDTITETVTQKEEEKSDSE